MLVGDVIMSAREAVPDLPGVIPAPGTEIAFTAITGANPLNATTYYIQATYVNQWGESSPGPEVTLVVQASSVIQVDVTTSPFYLQKSLLTQVNIYIGTSSGGEIQQFIYASPFANAGLFVIDSTIIPLLCTPPSGNSAFMPDSSGAVASASQVFRWLTDGLLRLSGLNGGIPDFGGFGTIYGQANYVVPSDFQTISDGWYDGYPLFMGSSSLVFRHNTISALSGMMSQTENSDRLIVELFAQPIRNAGTAALSSPLSISGVAAITGGPTAWVLPFGLLMLGTLPNVEVCSYTTNGNNFINLIRGMSATNPQAWPTNTPVQELNCMYKGLRAAQTYVPGQANNTLRLPSAWTPLMHIYLLSRYRKIEQQQSEADSLMKEFEAGAKEATKKRPAAGDRQIQPDDQVAVDVYPLLSRTFGGGIIP